MNYFCRIYLYMCRNWSARAYTHTGVPARVKGELFIHVNPHRPKTFLTQSLTCTHVHATEISLILPGLENYPR